MTGTTRAGGLDAITCTVSERAYLTGTFTLFLDPDDPFPIGFLLTGV